MTQMKGITCCGDCGYYNWKKHKCTRATDEGDARDKFYADCPLPDVVLPAVDAVPVVQQWISVKDKLPPKQGFYLAFVPEMARVALYYNGYDWIVDDDFYAFGAYEITHWMPLPEPPKMDGDA